MKLSAYSRQQLNYCLNNSDVILTPNKRLSLHLLSVLNTEYKNLNQQTPAVIQLPDILPFDEWVRHCYRDAQLTGQVNRSIVIDNREEQLLWDTVISTYSKNTDKHVAPSIAAEAQKAFTLMQDHRLDICLLYTSPSPRDLH